MVLFSLWKEKLSKVACDSGGWLEGSLETSLGYILYRLNKKEQNCHTYYSIGKSRGHYEPSHKTTKNENQSEEGKWDIG